MSSAGSSSPPPPACAACMDRRRKCEPGCVLAPYFPPEHWERYAAVRRVYGADNVANLLAELPLEQRAHAAGTLIFEARAAIKYPVYRCVSYIVVLQQMLKQKQAQLAAVHEELAGYAAAAAGTQPSGGAGSAPSPATQTGAVPMRTGGGPEAKEAGVVVGTGSGSGVQRGQGGHAHPHPHPQRAEEAREAATAARAARKQVMKERRDAAAQQQDRQVRHRAGTGPAVLPEPRVHGPSSRPDGRVQEPPRHQTAQEMADEVARVQHLLAVQVQAEEEFARQQDERMRQALAAARERNYPHQAQAGQHQQAMGFGAAPGQMALQAMSGNVSGATNMAASLPGGSADAGTFVVQQQPQQPQQPVNALPPPLADLPRQQRGDGGADDQFSSDPNRPPDGGGSS